MNINQEGKIDNTMVEFLVSSTKIFQLRKDTLYRLKWYPIQYSF